MGRPAKFKRHTALAVARDAIWRNGFRASTVKSLSEDLGITRSSFYNAFGSREELFFELLPDYAANSPDAVLFSAVERPVLPLITDFFQKLCRARAEDPEAKGCMVINAICELVPSRDGLGADLPPLALKTFDRLGELLRLAQTNQEITPDTDTRELALATFNLIIGLNVSCKVVRSEADLWSIARSTLSGLGILHERTDA